MLNQKLNEQDIQLAITLSQASNKTDKYIVLLKNEFGISLTKSDLSKVLNTSCQTLDRRIKEAMNVPNHLRSGDGEKSSYIFPVVEVAEYLANTVKGL